LSCGDSITDSGSDNRIYEQEDHHRKYGEPILLVN
jgi:hypothetical protein